jgi:histidinol phosphatase-like PHP family hydrolase
MKAGYGWSMPDQNAVSFERYQGLFPINPGDTLYDLHTHTILSDGELLPCELVRRMAVLGYDVVAITDHVDASNISDTIASIERIRPSAELFGVHLLTGVEITHVPPSEIPYLAKQAKKEGADIVVVHGETPVEPVAPGTNAAASACEYVDILAHPGLITEEDARVAADTGVFLEITSRGGHNRTNGHVVQVGRTAEADFVVDSDAHAPGDLMTAEARDVIAQGAGLSRDEILTALAFKADRFYH